MAAAAPRSGQQGWWRRRCGSRRPCSSRGTRRRSRATWRASSSVRAMDYCYTLTRAERPTTSSPCLSPTTNRERPRECSVGRGPLGRRGCGDQGGHPPLPGAQHLPHRQQQPAAGAYGRCGVWTRPRNACLPTHSPISCRALRQYISKAEDSVLGVVEDRQAEHYRVNVFGRCIHTLTTPIARTHESVFSSTLRPYHTSALTTTRPHTRAQRPGLTPAPGLRRRHQAEQAQPQGPFCPCMWPVLPPFLRACGLTWVLALYPSWPRIQTGALVYGRVAVANKDMDSELSCVGTCPPCPTACSPETRSVLALSPIHATNSDAGREEGLDDGGVHLRGAQGWDPDALLPRPLPPVRPPLPALCALCTPLPSPLALTFAPYTPGFSPRTAWCCRR